MAEALEKWPIELFSASASQNLSDRGRDQPPLRHCGFRRRIRAIRRRLPAMAILYDGQVKMAHLAIVAGHSVNGVARLAH